MFTASTHCVLMVGLLQAMGVHAEPSLIHSFPGACGLSTLRDEVGAFLGGWAHSPVAGHPPLVGDCSLSSFRDEVQTLPGRCAYFPVGRHTPSCWVPSPLWCL